MTAGQDAEGPEAAFQRGLAQGRFLIQKCGSCDERIFYPRALCPRCGSPNLTAVEACGSGHVYSTSVVRARAKDGADYNIAIVELVEGPRMMTRVVDIAPDKVRIDMAVRAFVGDVGGAPAVLFRPVNAKGSP